MTRVGSKKSLYLVLVTCILGLSFLIGCGDTSKNVTACGGDAGSARRGGPLAGKVLFLVGNVKDSTSLCSLDTQTLALQQEHVLPVDSNDVKIFSDLKTHDAYLVERWSLAKKNSRLTRFAGATGALAGESAQFAVNVHSLFRLAGNLLFVLGFDKGEVSVSKTDLSDDKGSFVLPVQTPKGIDLAMANQDAHFDLTLYGKDALYVLSQGIDLNTYKGAPAKFHRMRSNQLSAGLSAGLSEVEATFTVQTADAQATCVNAASALQISKSKVLLGCNPQYYGPVAGSKVNLFLVDVVAGGEPVVTLLKEFDSSVVQTIGALVATPDGSKVLVEEGVTSSNFRRTATARYWLELSSGTKIPSRFGGDAAYVAASDSFVFSCVEEGGELGLSCKSHTFAIVPGAQVTTGVGARELVVYHSFSFQGFQAPIFGQD